MKKLIAASPLFTRIADFCAKHALFKPTDTVVIGFSGGPDSLFLLHALTTLMRPEQIIAAHLDHGWRPESKSEALWCQQVAESLGVRFVTGHLQDYAAQLKNRGSKEDSARQARRLFLKTVAEKHTAQKIALAHHADDQLETFFIRLIRGAGLQGLASMQPRQGLYIRPLLELSKDEIISYLDANSLLANNPAANRTFSSSGSADNNTATHRAISLSGSVDNNTANNNSVYARPYLIDPSNISSDYLRNRIRHTLIPALISCDARANKNIHAAITHVQEVDKYLDEQARKTYAALKNSFFSQEDTIHPASFSEHNSLVSNNVSQSPETPSPKNFLKPEKNSQNQLGKNSQNQKISSLATNLVPLDNSLLEIKELQELHPLIRHRVLILWLCEAHVPFTPTKAFFAEIERFLFQSQTSSSHHIAPAWSIKKEDGSAFLKSL